MIVSNSAFASASVAPGRSRAIIELNSFPRPLSAICAAVNENGTIRATSRAGTSKSAGITPTTRYGSPLTRMSRPTIDGSPPYFDVQSGYIRIANRSASGVASLSVNARPTNGGRPTVEKNDAVTAAARTCSGLPPSLRLTDRSVISAASSSDRACAFRSM